MAPALALGLGMALIGKATVKRPIAFQICKIRIEMLCKQESATFHVAGLVLELLALFVVAAAGGINGFLRQNAP